MRSFCLAQHDRIGERQPQREQKMETNAINNQNNKTEKMFYKSGVSNRDDKGKRRSDRIERRSDRIDKSEEDNNSNADKRQMENRACRHNLNDDAIQRNDNLNPDERQTIWSKNNINRKRKQREEETVEEKKKQKTVDAQRKRDRNNSFNPDEREIVPMKNTNQEKERRRNLNDEALVATRTRNTAQRQGHRRNLNDEAVVAKLQEQEI